MSGDMPILSASKLDVPRDSGVRGEYHIEELPFLAACFSPPQRITSCPHLPYPLAAKLRGELDSKYNANFFLSGRAGHAGEDKGSTGATMERGSVLTASYEVTSTASRARLPGTLSTNSKKRSEAYFVVDSIWNLYRSTGDKDSQAAFITGELRGRPDEPATYSSSYSVCKYVVSFVVCPALLRSTPGCFGHVHAKRVGFAADLYRRPA